MPGRGWRACPPVRTHGAWGSRLSAAAWGRPVFTRMTSLRRLSRKLRWRFLVTGYIMRKTGLHLPGAAAGIPRAAPSVSHEIAIPYCTVKGFRRCLDLLRAERGPLERIDRPLLSNRRFSAHAVYPVLGALRFLGLVDADGRPQPELDCFLREDDLAGRRAVVERAYGDVLATLRFPVEDREEVDRLLVQMHGCAPGVAAFCSTFLLWLAAESGFFVARLGRRRRGRPPAHLSQLSSAARTLLERRSAAEEAGDRADATFALPEVPRLPARPALEGRRMADGEGH